MVIATRNRSQDLEKALGHATALPERPVIVVVDNASTDGTVGMVEHIHPGVDVLPLNANHWAAARTIGARHVDAPYVAFSDDDSWWAPGSLRRAADIFDAHPRLGLIAGRVVVGPEERLDPTCTAMRDTPLLQSPDLAGAAILGFVACGALVRRSAFLQVGGFEPRFEIGGEEELLALDLASAEWGLQYVDEVVAHHHPSRSRDPSRRQRREMRNALWSTWLRHPLPAALSRSVHVLTEAPRDATSARALAEALRGLPWVMRRRRKVPPPVEAMLSRLYA